jgi:CDP-paratose 2-epimerase
MQYIGFDGNGHQVRDCLHPKDLLPVIFRQFTSTPKNESSVCNLSGGLENSMSLAQLTSWCEERCEPHKIGTAPTERPFDIPWMVLDNRKAKELWCWKPETSLEAIFEEILAHSIEHPDWLKISNP